MLNLTSYLTLRTLTDCPASDPSSIKKKKMPETGQMSSMPSPPSAQHPTLMRSVETITATPAWVFFLDQVPGLTGRASAECS